MCKGVKDIKKIYHYLLQHVLCSCYEIGNKKGELKYGNTNNQDIINDGCKCGNCTWDSCFN